MVWPVFQSFWRVPWREFATDSQSISDTWHFACKFVEWTWWRPAQHHSTHLNKTITLMGIVVVATCLVEKFVGQNGRSFEFGQHDIGTDSRRFANQFQQTINLIKVCQKTDSTSFVCLLVWFTISSTFRLAHKWRLFSSELSSSSLGMPIATTNDGINAITLACPRFNNDKIKS